MAGHGSKLPQVKSRAVAALLSSSTQAEAAQKAGISLATLKRYLQLPEFQKALEDADRQFLDHLLREGAREYAQRNQAGAFASAVA